MVDRQLHDQPSLRFLVPALLLGCGAILIFLGVGMPDLQVWLDRAGPWAPIAFVFAGVASMSLLVPKTAVSVTAGALFGTPLGCLLMLIIAITAAALNYAIGRWWLHESLNRKFARLGHRDAALWIGAIRAVASEGGFRFHLLIRLAPVPTMLVSYAMGASGSRVRPFLMAAAVAVIPQALWVHGGTAATLVGDPSVSPLRWASVIVSFLAAIAIAIVVPQAAIKRVESIRNLQLQGLD